MPDLASVLKQEIRRLARKEVAALATQHSKQIRALKATVRDLRNQVATLENSVKRAVATSSQATVPEADGDEKAIRISPRSIRQHRKRLGLSQAQLSKLLGVSTTTVTFWESGRTAPRGKNRGTIAELRKMGVRDVKVLLEAL